VNWTEPAPVVEMKGLNVPLSYAVVGRLAALGGRRAAASDAPLRHATACLSAGLQECSAAEADAG